MIRKYIHRCKQLFPVYGKYERLFLKQLQQQATDFIAQNPNLTYEELVTQFGSPKDIVVGYYDTIDDDYLLKKLNLVKTIRRFFLAIVLVVVLFVGYRSYVLYQIWLEAQKETIIYEDETIEYIYPTDEDNNSTNNNSNIAE